MKNPKRKGSSFERNIAKRLSLFLSEGKRDDLLWRSQSSGARFTSRMKTGKDTKNQSGDITFTDSDAEWFIELFSIEVKNYKDINLWSMIEENKTGLYGFWTQTKRDAKLSNKIPMLIVKQNYKPEILLINSLIIENFRCIFKDTDNENVYVFYLEDFLSQNINIIKEYLLGDTNE